MRPGCSGRCFLAALPLLSASKNRRPKNVASHFENPLCFLSPKGTGDGYILTAIWVASRCPIQKKTRPAIAAMISAINITGGAA